MTVIEGRGYLLRSAPDGPWGGWVGSRFLDEGLASVHAAPGRALYRLQQLAALCPGGFALAWDHPPAWMEALHPEARAGWWEALSGIPGLTLHFADAPADLPGGAFRGWIHGSETPSGAAGELWRNGFLGWIPSRDPGGRMRSPGDTANRWSFPDLGSAAVVPHEELAPGWTWGELLLPVGVLGAPELHAELLPLIGDLQARLEKALALRLAAEAFPALPFARRGVSWRIGLLGGAEFLKAHGDAEAAAKALTSLAEALRKQLRAPVLIGACHDAGAAFVLGRQAMREGLPWRMSLPLPPAPPSFAPGLTGDPRDASPLAARTQLPGPLAALLDHPAVATLRVPAVPPESGVASLLEQLRPAPALRWLPPHLPPPGPFEPERPWPLPAAYPFPADPTAGETPSLFDLEAL